MANSAGPPDESSPREGSKFQVVGNEPRNWLSPAVAQNPLVDAIIGEAQNYQERIDSNKAVLRKQQKQLGWGVAIGFLAPIVWIVSG